MNDKQYEEYRALKDETDDIKGFIDWCEGKGKSRIICQRHYKRIISIGRKHLFDVTEIALPQELQNELVELLKRHVEQNERKMEQL